MGEKANTVRWWMEFLEPTTAKVVARYKHPSWPAYAAITRNVYGAGAVTYVGFMPSDEGLASLLQQEVVLAGAATGEGARFPVIVRGGQLQNGHGVAYVLNYSAQPARYVARAAARDLLTGRAVAKGAAVELAGWGVALLEEGVN